MIQGEYTDEGSNARRCFLRRAITFPQRRQCNSLCGKANVRNINCKHYLTCLDAAALVNARDLGCENCGFRTDNTYKMTIRDFKGLMRLYCEIMSPAVTEFIEEKK